MRVIVTGAAGFVGSHFCDLLLSQGHEVLGFDMLVPQVHGGHGLQPGADGRGFPPWPSYMDERVQPWIGDVGNTDEVYRALRQFQPDVVVHLAAFVGVGQSWSHPALYLYGGPVITASLYEAIRRHNAEQDKALQDGAGEAKASKVRRVFVAGSMSSYGEGPTEGWSDLVIGIPERDEDAAPVPTFEEWPQRPTNPYAYSKMYAEQVALNLGAQMGIETVIGRFFNVLGSRQSLGNPYTGVVAMWASTLLAGQAPIVFEDGEQSRDFIHVSDVARAILTILERGQDGEVYNVGRGERVRILDVAEWLCRAHGGGGIVPRVTGIKRAGDIRHCYADASKLRALGWAPVVTLDEALDEQWTWAQTQPEDATALLAGMAMSLREAERDGVIAGQVEVKTEGAQDADGAPSAATDDTSQGGGDV